MIQSLSRSNTHRQTIKKTEIDRIVRFIRDYVNESKVGGVVLGLSGGIDSTVVASLAARALGPEKVLGVFLFEDDSKGSKDYKDAKLIASELGIETIELEISPAIESLLNALRKSEAKFSRLTLANLKSRTRMILLYGIANNRNLLVIGTGDKSEIELGYFTKYGDGGVDLLPIGHLYKTEVLELARELGIPSAIVDKPSSPRLWRNQKATDELPTDYPVLDKLLDEFLVNSKDPKSIGRKLGIDPGVVEETVSMHSRSSHKRAMPPSLKRRPSG